MEESQYTTIGKRPYNEDRHTIDKSSSDFKFYGVYDGHGGSTVSDYLKHYIHMPFVQLSKKYPFSERSINKIFEAVNQAMKNNYGRKIRQVGSTCLITLLGTCNNKKHLTVINLGDCRAVLCENDFAVPLSKDHKPYWFSEQQRIKNLGGTISFDGYDHRVKDLSVSRAFGDLAATPYITHVPDIIQREVTRQDKFLVMATDGLWDVISNQDVVNLVLKKCYLDTKKKENRKNIAKILAQTALKKGSEDNITVIVIFFH